MKHFFTVVIVAAILLTPFAAKSQSAASVAFIDLQKVMLESEPGKQIRGTLTKEAERLKSSLDGKQAELQRLKDAVEKQGATITPEARAQKEKQDTQYCISVRQSSERLIILQLPFSFLPTCSWVTIYAPSQRRTHEERCLLRFHRRSYLH